MYLAHASKWDRQRLVGLAGSALVNGGVLAIFVGLASGAVHETGAGNSLTVIAFSQAGLTQDEGQSAKASAAEPAEAPAPRTPRPPHAARSETAQAAIAQNAQAHALTAPAHAVLQREQPIVRPDLALVAPAVMIAPQALSPSASSPHEVGGMSAEAGAQAKKNPSESRANSGGGAAKYAASVMRHLMRYRRQNTVGAGAAYIHFTVIEDGRCRDIGVARSSGSSRFDHAAMQLVRRAAPFPQPPHGQPRSFNFEITGS
ncbi:energy transducer TonB [Novosphingobium sp. BW1]|uniref:energy transducer TonB n=1 Tax=Novosphingobium sp. BW1 TaxID=2592621 RepID=UPI0011DEC346|nr:TonB family protein [Novosphingobium sp. BW1]TYC86892.1 TonB C-terminal domain-containing protein [Novosphingobium sp. BW1]